jgi:hypothetical protein
VNPFDFLNENRSRLHVLGYLLSFRLYRDRIDALSPIVRDYLVGRMRFVRKVELAPFTFAPLGEELVANRVFEKQNLVVWAGSLHEGKDPLFFLGAVLRMRDALIRSGTKVVIAGRGELESSVREFITANAMDSFVEVRFYENVLEILKYSKLFVSTQKVTNYPSRVLLEAYALNNQVLCLDTGDSALFKKFIDIEIVREKEFDAVFSEKISGLSARTVNNSLDGIEAGNRKFMEWFQEYYR